MELGNYSERLRNAILVALRLQTSLINDKETSSAFDGNEDHNQINADGDKKNVRDVFFFFGFSVLF